MRPTRPSVTTAGFLFLLCLTGPAAPVSSGETDSAVRKIRSRYAAVNRDVQRYKKVERDLPGYSLEGGTLVGYYSGPTLRKVVATYFGESGYAVEEFYLWDGRLFFVLRTVSHYVHPVGSPDAGEGPAKVARTEQSRFYFDHGRLIRLLGPNHKPVPVRSAEAQERQRDLLRNLRDFTARLRPSGTARKQP